MPLFPFVTIQALNWVFGVPVSYINWSEIIHVLSLANLESVNILLQGIMAFLMIAVPGIFTMFVNDLTIDTTFENVQVTKTEYVPMQVRISNRERSWGIEKAYTLASSNQIDMACFEIDALPEIMEQKNEYVLKEIEDAILTKFDIVKANTQALLVELDAVVDTIGNPDRADAFFSYGYKPMDENYDNTDWYDNQL